jgi:hypothetical protein
MKITRKNDLDGFKVIIETSEIRDLAVIEMAITNEIQRYRKMGWNLDEELKDSYECMKKVYNTLHEALIKFK